MTKFVKEIEHTTKITTTITEIQTFKLILKYTNGKKSHQIGISSVTDITKLKWNTVHIIII